MLYALPSYTYAGWGNQLTVEQLARDEMNSTSMYFILSRLDAYSVFNCVNCQLSIVQSFSYVLIYRLIVLTPIHKLLISV